MPKKPGRIDNSVTTASTARARACEAVAKSATVARLCAASAPLRSPLAVTAMSRMALRPDVRFCRTIENSARRGKDGGGAGVKQGRSDLCGFPQRLVDPALPTFTGRAKLLQNITVNAQGNLFLRLLRFRPPATATEPISHQPSAHLV